VKSRAGSACAAPSRSCSATSSAGAAGNATSSTGAAATSAATAPELQVWELRKRRITRRKISGGKRAGARPVRIQLERDGHSETDGTECAAKRVPGRIISLRRRDQRRHRRGDGNRWRRKSLRVGTANGCCADESTRKGRFYQPATEHYHPTPRNIPPYEPPVAVLHGEILLIKRYAAATSLYCSECCGSDTQTRAQRGG
jgi:hypothetical protein